MTTSIASGKIRIALFTWQKLYGGFGQASATLALLEAEFAPIVTRHWKDLIDGFRGLSFAELGGRVDVGIPTRWIEKNMAGAVRDSTPICYDKIMRVLVSRLASAASAGVAAGSPASWDALVTGALALNRKVESGAFNEAHFDELLEGMNRAVSDQDTKAGLVTAAMRANEPAADAAVSTLSLGGADQLGAPKWFSVVLNDLLRSQGDEPDDFVAALGQMVPFVPQPQRAELPCTNCRELFKATSKWCQHCGSFRPGGWECNDCGLACGADFESCPREKWYGCPGKKHQGRRRFNS